MRKCDNDNIGNPVIESPLKCTLGCTHTRPYVLWRGNMN